MKKLLASVRNQWIKAQLNSPSFVQQTVLPRLHAGKEVARLLTKPYLPVIQLQGLGSGGSLTVTYVGRGYAKTFVKGTFFVAQNSPIPQH